MALPSYAMNQTSFPQMYERWLVGPLFRPWAELAVEALAVSPGDRVLDIACGTGIVARVARQRLGAAGQVVGVDVSADMLGVAREAAPDIDWREGNAGALPLRDGERFDVVVCQQGMQFFPDRRQAAAQMRLALAGGGRLAVATWRSDEEIPLFRDLRRVAERHLGAIVDQRHSLGEATALEALLREAGLADVESKTLSRLIRLDDAAMFLRLNTMALVGMSGAGKTMGEDERKRVVAAVASESAPILERYADGPAIAFDISTNFATARG